MSIFFTLTKTDCDLLFLLLFSCFHIAYLYVAFIGTAPKYRQESLVCNWRQCCDHYLLLIAFYSQFFWKFISSVRIFQSIFWRTVAHSSCSDLLSSQAPKSTQLLKVALSGLLLRNQMASINSNVTSWKQKANQIYFPSHRIKSPLSSAMSYSVKQSGRWDNILLENFFTEYQKIV